MTRKEAEALAVQWGGTLNDGSKTGLHPCICVPDANGGETIFGVEIHEAWICPNDGSSVPAELYRCPVCGQEEVFLGLDRSKNDH